ncbi:MAG: glycosyltransferase family 4 protein [Desulfococcaceae bacterium]
MRIGIDASNLRAGGGLTHLVEILKTAEPVKHSFKEIIVWGGEQTLQKLPTEKSWLKLIFEPFLNKGLFSRFYWQKIKLSHLAQQHCDVLFVPGGLYTGDFRPFVTMSRNLLPFEYREMQRYFFSMAFFRLLLLFYGQGRTFRKADGVIFLTEYARSVVKQKINIKGLQAVIPHGINFQFCQTPRSQKSIDKYSFSNPFRFLYVSIITVYKHQWYVADAVAKLRKQGIPVALDLVGPEYPPALKRLKQTIRKVDPHENFIRYKGAVPYSQLSDYYHKADAFIFASSCENMPNILLEAMASGLPIACSDRGPMPEILGKVKSYFDPEKPDEITEVLRFFIENPTLREQAAWSAFHKSQAYSWERCADETFSFLRKIVQNKKYPK